MCPSRASAAIERECEHCRRAKMTDEDCVSDAKRKLVAFVIKITASLVLHPHVS
ncbi:unnamed protein product [Ixodes persulcatus]